MRNNNYTYCNENKKKKKYNNTIPVKVSKKIVLAHHRLLFSNSRTRMCIYLCRHFSFRIVYRTNHV